MGRYASDSGSATFTPAPVGTHVARCFRIIDLGTQHGEYKGKPTRRNQILVSWELPDELINIENEMKPITVSKFYTNSLGEKATLRADLEAWRGRAFTEAELQKFDLESILGAPCLITVVGGENGKTKVSGVSGLPKNTVCPPQVNKNFTFWLEVESYDQDKFEEISDGIKNIIKKSEDWAFISGGTPAPTGNAPYDDVDDSIPF